MQPNSALRNWKTQFFLIWIVQALSWVGSSLVHFALIWWLTETTGSATVLAHGCDHRHVARHFPRPHRGACVDRWNRRTVLMAADGLVALATLILALIHNAGWMQPWHIYAVLFVRSCAGSFHWPAMQASTSLMVPKEQLARVAGMNQTLQGVTNIITPPLGAVLLGILPLYGILGIDVVTAILAITPILINLVHIPQPEAQPVAATEAKPTLWRDMGRWAALCAWLDGLMIVMVIAALINLVLNPAFALMPLLVTKHFGGDALQLAG
jgi:DHA3 family macrolide efflux protein-like MFS transporter